MEEDLYIVVQWPDSQYLFEQNGFKSNCFLINDIRGKEKFGSSSYFVNRKWYYEKFRKES